MILPTNNWRSRRTEHRVYAVIVTVIYDNISYEGQDRHCW